MDQTTNATRPDSKFVLRCAQSDQDLTAAQRLRYRVFVQELGGNGALVDHEQGLERDRYDPFFDHLILFDQSLDVPMEDRAIGVYRVMRNDQAERAGGYYSEDEYDLSVLKASGRRLLELGRSCVDVRYRGGTAMFHLWNGLASYVRDHDIDILFGVASFHGTDVQALAQSLSFLHQNHLAPGPIRVSTRPDVHQSMDLIPAADIDRKQALVGLPALIKAYLRLGGFVGEGAFVDHDFNTVDVSLVMDTARMADKYRNYYTKGRAA